MDSNTSELEHRHNSHSSSGQTSSQRGGHDRDATEPSSEALASSGHQCQQPELGPETIEAGVIETGTIEEDTDLSNGSREPNVPLTSLLESLLFVADDPVEPSTLAKALEREISEVETGLAALASLYEERSRGLRIQWRAGRVQLVTNPLAAQAIEDFLNLDLTTHLSGPALETLAVVAYQQPVTRAQIEAVRGVDCTGVLRKLQQQGLIDEVGRLEAPGRPILYGVTDLFMQHFGLLTMRDLPSLPEVDADALQAAVDLAEEELSEEERESIREAEERLAHRLISVQPNGNEG